MNDKINLLAGYVEKQEKQNSNMQIAFTELLGKYLIYKQIDTKECTQYDKLAIFGNYITPHFVEYKMVDITKVTLSEWQAALWNSKKANGKRLSHNYLTKIRGYLYGLLEWCECVYSVPNLLKSLRVPKNTDKQTIIAFWELAEFNAFIPSVKDIFYSTLFYLLFYGGFRIGEVMALTETDFDGKAISITKTLSRKTLDGERYKITATKNYKNRVTPLPLIVINKLNDYIAYKRSEGIAQTFLFGGAEPMAETTLRRKFKEYLKCGGQKRITLHGFRHSYVSMLVYLGVGTKKIAELIGDTEQQVIETYSHLYKSDTLTAVDRINGLTS